jgi:hypothetical protein
VSNSTDPLSRLPWFEDLRARAEHVAADALGLLAEFRATLDELDRARNLARTWASQEERGEQDADPAGDGKGLIEEAFGSTATTNDPGEVGIF